MQPRLIGDLREYLEELRRIGELIEIDAEVDWNLEMAAIIRRVYEQGAPAPLFKRIKGIDPQFRAFGAPGGTSRQAGLHLSRVALSLGLDARAGGREIIERLAAARKAAPVPPRRVATGPCKENIRLGEKADLLQFPTPFLHEGDGGRYFGTWATIVAQTPDKKWTNWSIARAMLLDSRRMTGIVHPLQHLGMIHAMWKERGEDMPFAMFQGGPPFIPFVSGMPIPAHVSEADYMGGYFGRAVDVVRCETVDLDVPATAEIVVEGFLSHKETAPEGPMGEYAGYLWPGEPTQRPVYNITAITHRNQPILPIVVAGEPVEEDHTAQGIPSAAELLVELREAGHPVTLVWTTLESANHWLVVTVPQDWRQRAGCDAATLCRRIGTQVFERSKFGAVMPKVLVINDDVDATNTAEVVWAFATRCHPVAGEIHFDNEATSPLVAFLENSEKISGRTPKVVYNCLPPEDWAGKLPKRTSFKYNYSADLQARVLSRWGEYGFRV
jgi:UbiD family decarboxylase